MDIGFHQVSQPGPVTGKAAVDPSAAAMPSRAVPGVLGQALTVSERDPPALDDVAEAEGIPDKTFRRDDKLGRLVDLAYQLTPPPPPDFAAMAGAS